MTTRDKDEHRNSLVPAVEEKIGEALKQKSSNDKISCAAAHRIAANLMVSPYDVGQTADLQKLKIHKCLLGLFGYAPQKKIIKPMENMAPELETAIQSAVKENRIACLACWEIADRLDCTKIDVGCACDALSVKITPCQLGAF